MTGKMKTLAELFADEEAKAKARYEAEKKTEEERRAALTPEERAAEDAGQQARYEELFSWVDPDDEDNYSDEDEEEGDDGEFDDE